MGISEAELLSNFIKFRLELNGEWREIAPPFCDSLGYDLKQVQELNFKKLIHPDDSRKVSNFFAKLNKGEQVGFDEQLRFLKKSGEPITYSVSCELIRDRDGDPDHLLFHLYGGAEQSELIHKLEEREQQFNSLFKYNPQPVYCFDLEGNFEDVNEKLVEFTGYSRDQLLNLNYSNFVIEEDLERTRKHFKKAVNGEPGQYEIRVKIKGGEQKEIRVTKFPRLSGDEVTGVFGILQDVTEEKIAQRKLERSEQRWQKLVEQNPQPVQIVREGKIVFLNKAGANYYGASSPEEVIGKPILDFPHSDYLEKVQQRKVQLEKNNQVEPTELMIIDLKGRERYVEAYSIPVSYNGESAIQTVIHDITELKEKQDTIEKSLKEKEMLLQEIHHRVKNNLAMISSMLELQIIQSTEKAAINALRESQLRIQSIAIIHEKLYQSESLYDIGFDKYIQELVETVKNMYNNVNGDIQTVYDLQHVSLDITQAIPCSLLVNEVIVNCFKHAFPNQGKGTIHMKVQYDEPDLRIEISDDGTGLPDDFDIEKQESLGMTLIQALTNQLEGEVRFLEGLNGKGTSFRLKFQKNSDS